MDVFSAIFHLQSRKIDLLIPSVVTSENHTDTLVITDHPIEKISNNSTAGTIVDNAYKRPDEVIMQCGFAGGGSLLDPLNTTAIGLSYRLSPKEVYQKLRDLQSSRLPFDVVTGKRVYHNMLIKTIEVTTDINSENVLNCKLTLREVIMSRTLRICVADKSDMRDGVSTSAVQNTGTKSTTPVSGG